MTEENKKEAAPKSDQPEEKKGLFTESLKPWQIILGLLLVAWLTYGKYQEMVAKQAPPAITTPAPAK